MKVVILRGISGSGKSTLANKLLRDTGRGTIIVTADDFWMQDGDYSFDIKRLNEAHNYCLREYLKCLLHIGHDRPKLIVVDNTNTRAAEIAPYYQLAQAHGAAVIIVTIHCDPAVAWDRNAHNTPAKDIYKQYRNLLREELPPWWKQDVAFRISTPGQDIDGLAFDTDAMLQHMSG